MCNFSVGFEERGWMKAKLADVKNLMEAFNLSVENAMDALKVPENEQQEYRALLEAQQSENS